MHVLLTLLWRTVEVLTCAHSESAEAHNAAALFCLADPTLVKFPY